MLLSEGNRLCVPWRYGDMARFTLMHEHHDEIGHPGYEKCLKLMKETYWFPKISRFVAKYGKSCLQFVFTKGVYERDGGFLHQSNAHRFHLTLFVLTI